MALDKGSFSKTGDLEPMEGSHLPISLIWGAFLREEYNEEELAKSWQRALLERKLALQSEGILAQGSPIHVADVAIGTGFGILRTIDLLQQSHPDEFVWWCSDGSQNMIEACRKETQRLNLSLQFWLKTWHELGDDHELQNRFHFVLCRGSSINYVLGWEEGGGPEERSRWIEAVLTSAQSFFRIITPGGEMYIDVTTQEQLDTERDECNCVVDIEGVRHQLHEVVIRKEAPPDDTPGFTPGSSTGFMREWTTRVAIGEVSYPPSTRKSLHLPHQELITILESVGFQQVKRESVRGEQYTGFFFKKPKK